MQVNTPQGAVVIKKKPEKIVTLGAQWIDTVLAFGTTPVGYYDAGWAAETPPWIGDKLSKSKELKATDLVAQVTELKPDLILIDGQTAASAPEQFASLREIAPTVPGATGRAVDPWEDLVALYGTITNQEQAAETVTEKVNSSINDVVVEFPKLKDKTYALAYMYSDDQIQVMADPNDGAGLLFTQLGMKPGKEISEEFAKRRQSRFPIGVDKVSMLDADLLAIATGSEKLSDELRDKPGYQGLTAVQKRAVANLSVAELVGLNQPSPLNIPFLLDQMRPQFENAAKGKKKDDDAENAAGN